MAMTVGELVGIIDMEDRGFASELRAAESSLTRLQSTTTSKTASIESTVTKAFQQVEQAIKDGLDPTEALADVDRLVAGFATDLDRMETEAAQGGQGIVDQLRTAMDDLDRVMRREGAEGGEALRDGLKDGLRGAERVADDAGRGAGRRFGDGVEREGGGGGKGGRMAGIGSSLVGGLKAGAIGVAAAAGAAIGSALMGAIETAMEREDLLATLSASLGAVGPEAERLGGIAGDLYNEAFGESLEDVTTAVGAVVSSIGGMRDANDAAVKDIAGKALNLSKVFGVDVADSVGVVGQLIKSGLVKDADEGLDLLVASLQKVPTAVREDLLDALDEYGPFMAQIGVDGEKAFNLLVAAADKGKFGVDKTGDALKEFTLLATDMSTNTKSAYDAIGLSQKKMTADLLAGGDKGEKAFQKIVTGLRNIKDPVKQSQAALALFGTPLEDLSTKDIPEFLATLDTTKNRLGDVAGAAETAGKTVADTGKHAADEWSRSWEGVFAAIGDQAMIEIRKLFPSPDQWGEDWDKITSWFSGTVGPFFSDTWNSVSETTSEIWTSIGDWLSQKVTEIGEFFSTGWETLKTDTSTKWESVKTTITEKINAAVDWLRGIPGKVKDFFSTGWSDLKSDTAAKWEEIKTAATEKATELVTWLKGLPGKVKAVFADAASWLLQAGKDMIAGMINGVKAKAGELAASAKAVVQDAVNAAKDALGIHSPSKVFEGIGHDSVAGFIAGFAKGEGPAAAMVERVVAQAMAAARKAATTRGGLIPGAPALAGMPKPPQTVDAAHIATLPGVAYSGTPGAAGGVTVNMPGAVIREEADIDKFANKIGFKVLGQGLV